MGSFLVNRTRYYAPGFLNVIGEISFPYIKAQSACALMYGNNKPEQQQKNSLYHQREKAFFIKTFSLWGVFSPSGGREASPSPHLMRDAFLFYRFSGTEFLPSPQGPVILLPHQRATLITPRWDVLVFSMFVSFSGTAFLPLRGRGEGFNHVVMLPSCASAQGGGQLLRS